MDNFSVGVVVFPGSNCDRDVSWALEGCLDIRTKYLWHESSDLSDVDAIVLPGGFSYGDYLRCGAMAAHSPIMKEVMRQAERAEIMIPSGLVLLRCGQRKEDRVENWLLWGCLSPRDMGQETALMEQERAL